MQKYNGRLMCESWGTHKHTVRKQNLVICRSAKSQSQLASDGTLVSRSWYEASLVGQINSENLWVYKEGGGEVAGTSGTLEMRPESGKDCGDGPQGEVAGMVPEEFRRTSVWDGNALLRPASLTVCQSKSQRKTCVSVTKPSSDLTDNTLCLNQKDQLVNIAKGINGC